MKKIPLLGCLGLGLLGLSPSAFALCTVLCSCSASTSSVAFGVHDPLSGSATSSTGNVAVTCGGVLGLLVPYDIELSPGGYGTYSARQMGSGVNRLNYNLYTSGTFATVWGDGSGSTQIVSGSVTIVLLGGTTENHTVYGRIPAGQTSVVPGSYSDTVTVTVIYQ